ncbi:cyanophycinase [Alkalihalobacillus sp. CinArs1]|uniref:cyanophycinase n=1 Tax=Alkalihalobacillus sp. CinArs1 TaxID=2995314 RepID=UPI0022DD8CA3|nr:cyanophycinase [Alkalihalobacillus sp. CinArs1]
MSRWKRTTALLAAAFLGIFLVVQGIQKPEPKASTSGGGEEGALVIVGGALSPDNEEVYNKFLALAQAKRGVEKEDLKIGILPTASSSPIESATSYKKDFVRYGATEGNIDILPIAVNNDRSTEEDESKWIDNGSDEELAEQVKQYDAIWFVGGNQLHYTTTLLKDDEETPVLEAIKDIREEGAVLGGSSAGAAIMSDPMIGAGSSLGALSDGVTDRDNYGDAEDNRVFLTEGLGFFEEGIVDQHFVKRGRFGRLMVAAWESQHEMAYGIDENSAMVVYPERETIEVVGESGLVIVDLADAKKTKDYPAAMKDVKISYIEKGDRYNFESKTYEITEDKPLITDPYYQPNSANTGIFGEDALKQVLTYDLIDNTATTAVGLAIDLTDEDRGEGFKLTFKETKDTKGYWGKIDGVESYAAVNVNLDLAPMKVKLKVDNMKEKKMEEFE